MTTEHKHGTMNTDVQEKTFEGFISYATKVSIFCIVFLVFLAIVNG